MTIAFACPVCQQTYKAPADVAGRTTKCRKCGTLMQIPVPAGGAKPEPVPPPPPVPAASPIAPAPMPPPPPPPVRVVEEEDIPVAELDKPVVTVPPHLRKKPGRKKVLVLVAASLFAALCLAGVVGGVVWFFFLRPSGPGDEIKYLPDDPQWIASLRVEQILNSAAFKDLKREIPEIEKWTEKEAEGEIGLPLTSIAQVTIGGRFEDFDKPIRIFKTKSAISADEVKSHHKRESYKEVKVGGYTLYQGDFESFCIPESKTVVIGRTDQLRKILVRDAKPKLSEGLQAAIKQVDFSKSLVFAVNLKDLDFPKSTVRRGLGEGPFEWDDFVGNLEKMIKEIEGVSYQAQVGSDFEATMTILCKDAKSAEDYRKILEGLTVLSKKLVLLFITSDSLAKEVTELYESQKWSASGSKVTTKGKVKADLVIRIYKEFEKKLPKERWPRDRDKNFIPRDKGADRDFFPKEERRPEDNFPRPPDRAPMPKERVPE